MRRTRTVLLAMLAALSLAVVLTATATAGKPAIWITGISVKSNGEVTTGTCSFGGAVTFNRKAAHGTQWVMTLYTVSNTSVATQTGDVLGRGPTSTGTSVTAPSSSALSGSYYFDITLTNAKGTTLANQHSSTFSMTGCPYPDNTVISQYP